jgi:hypothetical protein
VWVVSPRRPAPPPPPPAAPPARRRAAPACVTTPPAATAAPPVVAVKYPDGLLLHVFEAARFSDATFGEAVEAFGLLPGAKKAKLERRQTHALAAREE